MFWFTLAALLNGVNHVNLQSPTNSDAISGLLEKTVGANYFQEYLNKHMTTSAVVIDGAKSVEDLATSLRSKLEKRIDAVGTISRFMEATSHMFTENPGYPECCENNYKDDLWDPIFRMPIDKREMCMSKSKTTPKSVKSPIVDMLQMFISNSASVPGMLTQYYGTTSGAFYQFPSVNQAKCDGYDPRTRPWYDSTLNKNHKDLVIVMDTSIPYYPPTSGDNDITEAPQYLINATKAVVMKLISPLNSKDSVLILPTTDITPEPKYSCFGKSFTPASDKLRNNLEEYFNVLEGETQDPESSAPKIDFTTKIITALTNAFRKIKKKAAKSSGSETVVCIVVGDLYKVDKELVLSNFKSIIADNHGHVLLMYSVSTTADVQSMLQLMEYSYKGDSVSDTITDVNKWDLKMYTYFPLNLDTPHISAPYTDTVTKLTVFTVTQPVTLHGILHGVAAIDISLDDLLTDLKNFNAGKKSYSFLYDSDDLAVLSHPMLPHNSLIIHQQILTIDVFEKMDLLNRILGSGGTNDSKSFEAKVNDSVRLLSRGLSKHYGVFKETVPSTYYCSKINVESTSLVLCLVLASDAKQETHGLKLFLKLDDIQFFYHNIKLLSYEGDQCRTYLEKHFKGKTAVKFTGRSFVVPQLYLYDEITREDVEKFTKIMQDRITDDVFIPGVVDDVHLTSFVDTLWITNTTLQDVPYIAWRYIATKNGVLRIEPPLHIPKTFQSTTAIWYQKAISVPKMTTAFSTPYLDTGGSGFVVSASRVIFEGNSEQIFGVMGADFTLHYLKVLVDSIYTDCGNGNYECFLIDEAGYLVTHDDWIYATSTEKIINVYYVHMMVLEPEVTKVLIKQGYLKQTNCTDVGKLLDYYQYKLEIVESGVSYNIDNKPAVKVLPIKNTNLYVVQKSPGQFSSEKCECSSSCAGNIVRKCDCPYCSQTKILTCSDEGLSAESILLCSPTSYIPANLNDSHINTPQSELERFDFCVSVDCASHKMEKDCVFYSVCQWCTHTKEGKPLRRTICRNIGHCWFGQVGRKSPYYRPTTEEKFKWIPVFIGLGVAAFVILVLAFVQCLRNHRKRQVKDKQLENVHKLVPRSRLITSKNIPNIFAHPKSQKRILEIKAEENANRVIAETSDGQATDSPDKAMTEATEEQATDGPNRVMAEASDEQATDIPNRAITEATEGQATNSPNRGLHGSTAL